MYSLVIHGGAENMTKKQFRNLEKALGIDNLEKVYKRELRRAIRAGENILKEGGSARSAVINAIETMENSLYFDAAKGSASSKRGRFTMDAALMDGKDKKYGACCQMSRIKNPIHLADHILKGKQKAKFIGGKAQTTHWAKQFKLPIVDNLYFYSDFAALKEKYIGKSFHGTVGAVALDLYGNISAGTSTGGLYNTDYGRIGDTPLIGISTYADNDIGGISTTGIGEEIIQNTVAYDIIAKKKYIGMKLDYSIEDTVYNMEKGTLGVIGIDSETGQPYTSYNTDLMLRGSVVSGGKVKVHVW
jgi:L-asparaginase / beta-aspartyl-peptidase